MKDFKNIEQLAAALVEHAELLPGLEEFGLALGAVLFGKGGLEFGFEAAEEQHSFAQLLGLDDVYAVPAEAAHAQPQLSAETLRLQLERVVELGHGAAHIAGKIARAVVFNQA